MAASLTEQARAGVDTDTAGGAMASNTLRRRQSPRPQQRSLCCSCTYCARASPPRLWGVCLIFALKGAARC